MGPIEVVGLVRFSYLSSDGGWARTPASIDARERFLFERERIEWRFQLFERYLVKSLDLQTDMGFRLVVLASTLMPDEYCGRLKDIASTRPYLAIELVEPKPFRAICGKTIAKHLAGRQRQLTFRVDDDDALATNYVQRVKEEALQISWPSAISFTKGLMLYFGQDRTEEWIAETPWPFLSQGMALCTWSRPNTHIYAFAHGEVARHLRTVCVAGAPAHLRCRHHDNDSAGAARAAKKMSVTLEEGRKRYAQLFPML